jgi:transposase
MRPQGSPEELECRRRRAVQLLREGLPPVEVARMVGADRRRDRRWNATHREHGLSGPKANSAPGPPTRLNREARAKREEALLAGTRGGVFPRSVDLSTGGRSDLRSPRRPVSPGSCLPFSSSRGLESQKPQRPAVERDDERIRTGIKLSCALKEGTPAGMATKVDDAMERYVASFLSAPLGPVLLPSTGTAGGS